MKLYATCQRCGAEYATANMVQTTSAKRGEGHAYICMHCATENEHYHTQNNAEVGTIKANAVLAGIEFESAYSDEYARNAFFEYRFIPTHDGSLRSVGMSARYGYDGNTCEYVSPRMRGLNRASKFCVTVDRLLADGHLSLNDSCGTHFHVSIDSMKNPNPNARNQYMDMIRRYYNSLFVPLCQALQADPAACERVFGRYLQGTASRWSNGYAKPIDMATEQTDHDDRYYFINCMADSNIEFRLNKFINAAQYQALMKMEVKMVQTIIANFCRHFNTPKAEIDASRYYRVVDGQKVASLDAYRKHKAQVTAEKLVAIYKEVAGI